jgi:hypothetical protein
MDLALRMVNFDYPGGPETITAVLAEVGQALESAGIINLSVMDHYLQMEAPGMGGPRAPMLEGYATLGFLAAHTESVELQLLVTGVTYRHPGLLVKILSTLDVLSGGRAMLGIGGVGHISTEDRPVLHGISVTLDHGQSHCRHRGRVAAEGAPTRLGRRNIGERPGQGIPAGLRGIAGLAHRFPARDGPGGRSGRRYGPRP